MKKEKYYITTPIYYINDKPHIGHAYTTITADALANYNRLKGSEVYFLTGTDENSQKNIEAAEKYLGKSDLNKKEIQKYLDEMSAVWQMTWDEIRITNNDFIRTTEPRHIKAVEKFFSRVWEKGDIYEGNYEGFYCTGCEEFKSEKELVDGKCPIHKTVVKKIKEKNYFFKLSKYRGELLDYIEKNPQFIMPESRRNEVVSYIRDFMEDVSITRESMRWGIEVPEIKGHALYVWFDALLNYLSGIGFGEDDEKFKKFWPADLQLVGKDIIKFHCALWPAMLMSAGLPLPKQVFAHGFFTINGEKMGKSLGNVVDPVAASKKYGLDALRYYLLREIPFGEDGDFSFSRLEERYNSDLANGLGNLVSRVLAMAEKYFDGKAPAKSKGDLSEFWKNYEQSIEDLKLHNALNLIWKEIAACDEIVDKEKPWELAKKDTARLAEIIYELLERIRHIAWALWPFLPETSEKILSKYGIMETERKKSFSSLTKWGGLKEGQKLEKGEALFPRIS
ncbi:MAG: methionine--tRNA ligase [bacterium]